MMRAVWIALLCAGALCARIVNFDIPNSGQVVLDLEMRSPGASWGHAGVEAAIARITIDGRAPQHVTLFAGDEAYVYSVLAGELSAGHHRMVIERDEHSAPGRQIEFIRLAARVTQSGDPMHNVLASAPILFARRNTIGQFSDVPLLMYCERLAENGRPVLQYTVIFSNEDGGTSTRALMARWGRTTDIEYVYKAFVDREGRVMRSTIQTRGHEEKEYDGPREHNRPLLIPVTDNNMVAGEGTSPIVYHLAPALVDLSDVSREEVMDNNPITYRIMAQELEREGKLRPYGTVDGEKISDPRNYVYIEAKIANRDSRMVAAVRLKGNSTWRFADLGRFDYGIERSGWIRTTVELPPGTTPADIDEIAFACRVLDNKRIAGVCRLEGVRKVFFLDKGYRPGASFWSHTGAHEISSGEVLTFPVRSR